MRKYGCSNYGYGITLACLLVFHAPDGSELWVESEVVKVIRPVGVAHREHVAPGTRSVLYLAGVRQAGWGVVESAAEVRRMVMGCPK